MAKQYEELARFVVEHISRLCHLERCSGAITCRQYAGINELTVEAIATQGKPFAEAYGI